MFELKSVCSISDASSNKIVMEASWDAHAVVVSMFASVDEEVLLFKTDLDSRFCCEERKRSQFMCFDGKISSDSYKVWLGYSEKTSYE